MEVESPGRLITVLVVFVGLLFAGWFFLLRDDSGSTPDGADVKPAPVPADVQQVLDAVGKQPVIDITTKQSVSGSPATTLRRVLDSKSDTVVTYDGKTLQYLQKGKRTFSLNPQDRCYFRASVPAPQSNPSSLVQPFLPAGSSNIQYTTEEKGADLQLNWTLARPQGAPADYEPPTGVILTDAKSHLLKSATLRQPGGSEQQVTVEYPTSFKAPAEPKRICKGQGARP